MEKGNYVDAYGYAFALAYWDYFGAESVSQVAAKGSEAKISDKVEAAFDVATLGKGRPATAAAKQAMKRGAPFFKRKFREWSARFAKKRGGASANRGLLRACFVSGTEVGTDQGAQSIETIVPGTSVWSYDHNSSEWRLSLVESVLVHEYDGDLITLTIGEEKIKVTGGHPFWVVYGNEFQYPEKSQMNEEFFTTRSGNWIDARNLQAENVLVARNGGLLRLTAVSSRRFRGTVYNLANTPIHNFAVGIHGILVHNKSLPNTGRWGGGSHGSTLESLNAHFLKHGKEVDARDAAHYLRKAEAFAQNLRGATKNAVPGATSGVTRYKKLGKYIDIDSDGDIISFGRQ